MKINKEIHRESPFFKRKMLDGVLDKFIEESNLHLEPIREEILNLDQLSFYFLGIGFFSTFIIGMLLVTLVSIYALMVLVIMFLVTLAGVYYRNYLK